jgi:hypothetical protein
LGCINKIEEVHMIMQGKMKKASIGLLGGLVGMCYVGSVECMNVRQAHEALLQMRSGGAVLQLQQEKAQLEADLQNEMGLKTQLQQEKTQLEADLQNEMGLKTQLQQEKTQLEADLQNERNEKARVESELQAETIAKAQVVEAYENLKFLTESSLLCMAPPHRNSGRMSITSINNNGGNEKKALSRALEIIAFPGFFKYTAEGLPLYKKDSIVPIQDLNGQPISLKPLFEACEREIESCEYSDSNNQTGRKLVDIRDRFRGLLGTYLEFVRGDDVGNLERLRSHIAGNIESILVTETGGNNTYINALKEDMGLTDPNAAAGISNEDLDLNGIHNVTWLLASFFVDSVETAGGGWTLENLGLMLKILR